VRESGGPALGCEGAMRTRSHASWPGLGLGGSLEDGGKLADKGSKGTVLEWPFIAGDKMSNGIVLNKTRKIRRS